MINNPESLRLLSEKNLISSASQMHEPEVIVRNLLICHRDNPWYGNMIWAVAASKKGANLTEIIDRVTVLRASQHNIHPQEINIDPESIRKDVEGFLSYSGILEKTPEGKFCLSELAQANFDYFTGKWLDRQKS